MRTATAITDRDEIDRLNAIALPPAYVDAWYCPHADGHLQATGIDARGRKQYRYHPDFRAAQEAAKYDRCASFGQRLARLRAKIEVDLRKRALTRDRAVAAVVRLLDLGHVRVGNEGYAKANKSFVARQRCAAAMHKLKGAASSCNTAQSPGRTRVPADYRWQPDRLVKKCQDLPGQHLFGWLDDAGVAHPVTSSDVNAYIRDAMGDDFTAKHFRTWGASVIAFDTLATAQGHVGLKTLLEPVTAALGNTPAIARKSYVHPDLIELARDREAQVAFRDALALPRTTRYLSRAERGLIAFLETGGITAKAA